MDYIKGKEPLLPRLSAVEVCPGYQLLLTFRNGEKRRYNARPLLDLPAYRDLPRVFSSARAAYGTVVWPGDLDVSPDALYLNSVPVEGVSESLP